MIRPNSTETKMVDSLARADTYFAEMEIEETRILEILIRKLGADSLFTRAANQGN